MKSLTFKRALGLVGLAALVYAGFLFTFLRTGKNGTAVAMAAGPMCPVSDAQNQNNQVYFVGCGGFF